MTNATADAVAPAKPKRDLRPWSKIESDQVRAEYPAGDIVALAKRLGRPYAAVAYKAHSIGIRRTSRTRRGTWIPTPEIDARIRDLYSSGRVQNHRGALARSIGWPPWAVSRRAVHLGLATPRTKEEPWHEDMVRETIREMVRPEALR